MQRQPKTKKNKVLRIVLIVYALVIVALLAVFVFWPRHTGTIGIAMAKEDLAFISSALDSYWQNGGSYPVTLDDLALGNDLPKPEMAGYYYKYSPRGNTANTQTFCSYKLGLYKDGSFGIAGDLVDVYVLTNSKC